MFAQPLELPNGVTLNNRFVKSAMEEELASNGVPGPEYVTLYQRWAQGQPGLMITGNVVVDRTAPTDPGVVVLEDDRHLDQFKAWAIAAKTGGSKIVMQINHPGRQIPKHLAAEPVAPSSVGVEVPGGRGLFNPPKALSEEEIENLIDRFVNTARLAISAGFDGVQIHAAHGYLVNQFLSPYTNRRDDQWGGSLENRSRFLFRIVKGMKSVLKPESIFSIKLNSADFQRGGFDEKDAQWVIKQLNEMGLDLLELSGGNYESPAMIDGGTHDSTNRREAFFLDFAATAKKIASMPLMVTGGFKSRQGMLQALASGDVDAVGLAKPFCVEPDLPKKMIAAEIEAVSWPVKKLKNQAFNSLAQMGWARRQIHLLATGQNVNLKLGTVRNLISSVIHTQLKNLSYKRWLRATTKTKRLAACQE